MSAITINQGRGEEMKTDIVEKCNEKCDDCPLWHSEVKAYEKGRADGRQQTRKDTLKEVQAWVEANHQKDVIWVVPFYVWLESEVQK
jgi:hypothetical protein